jgi:hypothetical protein
VSVRKVICASTVVAGLRLAAFWGLYSLEQLHAQSISLLPLVLLLYPEGLLVPKDHRWTMASALLFSAALVVGSFILVGIVALVISALRRSKAQ